MSKISRPTFLQIILSLLIFNLQFHGNSQTTMDPEQAILLKLKQHWSNPPSIKHWTSSSPTNTTSIHCTWPEIACAGGSVTGLSLLDKNITGTIPPFICDLQSLTLLDLQNNNIPGLFPTVLYNCSKLQTLDLSLNRFVGPIPGDVNRLSSRLRDLNLAYNNFNGDIPASIGRLSELRTLQIHLNEFNGTFPQEIGNLSNLESLWMAFNEFSPSMIPSSFTELKKLKSLWLSTANLIGKIPETIGNSTALKLLDLSANQLTGNIPSGLFLLRNLTTLHLQRNKLSGEIPRSVEALNLDMIDLSENELIGTIPDDFGKLTKLQGLALFSNQLSGEVPESIGRLPALQVIQCFSNYLSGELPPDFGIYSMLREFQVASNGFIGRLPENLCANGVLIRVTASDNYLTGELPSSLGNCSSLLSVRVHGNRLSGNIPAGLWTSFNLTTLMISDNMFTGHLPVKLATNLLLLEISNNLFSGEIPWNGISSWRNLMVFDASNNLFNGTIPQELTSLPLLTTLLLDRNHFSGNLPLKIKSWNSLTTLNLSGNRLSGQIPAAIGFLPALTHLDLSENELSGQIPPEIGLLRLNSLNLSSNSLTGRIPVEYENAVFNSSFLDNPGLCATNPLLGLDVCSSSNRKSRNLFFLLLAIFVPIAIALFVLAIMFAFHLIKNRPKRNVGSDLKWTVSSFQKLNFTELEILSCLSEDNIIGRGGSGEVYRVAVNGSPLAVKRIWNNRNSDRNIVNQFLAEAEILGRIHHSNIVKLWCYMSNEASKLLVYEYLENGSLYEWLHESKRQPSVSGSSVHRGVLDWPTRFKIAVGAARGLCYMHHDCSRPIVHRDMKSSNILLDTKFNAKIADFGLAMTKHAETKTMSFVAGSFGYIAPEYFETKRANEKIDVFGYGVVLLELATGRKAPDGGEYAGLAAWAHLHMRDGKPIEDALDVKIKEACYLDEMTDVFKLGIDCTDQVPSNRPAMDRVLQTLQGMNVQDE
ncbi:receptor-like protein kinase HSL1 [Cornus florida]|uniref:receptor-like protein kinase HSL1 n=1 Tax=Cornus florida TaxID=4283 RepID=UPI0028980537|nr:receptor-like protein kinase HSL1 [Cornus florida]